ncbi:MAG: lycopene cyclase domain-containing protein [Actinomycetia bacterium]|nr:lycopene cyclase domain-containing protein [Actinomycetes bacterium]MCH9800968.1 lycopene cyclase domain-containing protein [Actinomycetes bacterium]
MSYTLIAVVAVAAVIVVDLAVLRTRLLLRADFWIAYAIMFFFQLLTNGVLTGREVVQYADDSFLGVGNDVAEPVFIGSGRLFFAPVEDLLFGFAMILLILAVWIWLGRRGLQRTPTSGPPRWQTPIEAAE